MQRTVQARTMSVFHLRTALIQNGVAIDRLVLTEDGAARDGVRLPDGRTVRVGPATGRFEVDGAEGRIEVGSLSQLFALLGR